MSVGFSTFVLYFNFGFQSDTSHFSNNAGIPQKIIFSTNIKNAGIPQKIMVSTLKTNFHH